MIDSGIVGFLNFKLLEARNYLAVRDDAFLSSLRDINRLIVNGPVLGLDIDGTITDYLDTFRSMSNNWHGKVIIVTYRTDYKKTFDELSHLGIHFDELILSPTLDKSDVIHNNGIDVFIDDQDECFQNVSPKVLVLKVRNFANFRNGKWFYSNSTGKSIDE